MLGRAGSAVHPCFPLPSHPSRGSGLSFSTHNSSTAPSAEAPRDPSPEYRVHCGGKKHFFLLEMQLLCAVLALRWGPWKSRKVQEVKRSPHRSRVLWLYGCPVTPSQTCGFLPAVTFPDSLFTLQKKGTLTAQS